MVAWCSAADVNARLAGNPSDALCDEFAEQATSLLYVMSGRRFNTESTVISRHQVDNRGYVKLVMWTPVRAIVSAQTVEDVPVLVDIALSPAGTYAVASQMYANQFLDLTMDIGQNPPDSGRDACAALAAELLRGDVRYLTTGSSGTAPADVYASPRPVSISRQGVTYNFADPATLSAENLTGIYEVDLFLRAVNPTGQRHQPKVVTAS